MNKYDLLVTNAAGRVVPTIINSKPAFPYMGVGKYKPTGRKAAPLIATCADYPDDGNKIIPTLKEALIKCGLKDGMTISTHHHFRNGDLVGTQIFDIAHFSLSRDMMSFIPSISVAYLAYGPGFSIVC